MAFSILLETFVSNLVSLTCPSLQILGKTKFDKRNKTTSKTFDDKVMSGNYDIILIVLIFGQVGAIQKTDSRRRACKTYPFNNSNFLFYKNWKQNQKISNTVLPLFLWVKALYLPKNSSFLQKKCWNQQN